MNLASIDRVATAAPGGFLHRTQVWLKLLVAAVVLGVVLVTRSPLALAGILLLVVAVILLGRLPLRLVAGLALWPLFFGLLIALTAEIDTTARIALALRSVTAGCVSIALVLSTPYPQLFAPLMRVLPRLLADTLLMTYRSFFLLAARMDALLHTLRLRAALSWRHPVRSLQTLASAVGTLVLYSLELAERDYEVLALRGYEGRLRLAAGGRRREEACGEREL